MLGIALVVSLETIEVMGNRYAWLDAPQTASQGLVDKEQLKERVFLRPGEILETVPGMITTQHSGSGKANQYFLRGFDLDHGTDFASFVDGVPINLPSHAHGQGYTDVNFLIPETLETLEYSKGPHSVHVGDFSAAGSVDIKTQDRFDEGLFELSYGSYDYKRLFLMDSVALGDGSLSFAGESTRYAGPWTDRSEDADKRNALLKYLSEGPWGKWKLSLMAYENSWRSTDQIPERAIKGRIVDRFGSLDPDTGGKSERQSLNLQWSLPLGSGTLSAQAYALAYRLNLWSNFTLFLNDPVLGDEFEQADRRVVRGGQITYEIPKSLRIGVQKRSDDISTLGLYKSVGRERVGTISEDSPRVDHQAAFVEKTLELHPKITALLGLRYDQVEDANQSSPKLSLQASPDPAWKVFASAGRSFHSNDMRSDEADTLVPVTGYEVGSTHTLDKLLRTSFALWQLQSKSELAFVGDEGTTEAGRGSRREGLDFLLQFAPNSAFHSDLELSWAKARYREDHEGEGRRVEGALPFAAAMGFGYQIDPQWSLTSRFRHFGRRDLKADGSEQSHPTTIVNLQTLFENADWEMSLDALNLFNSRDHDIDYVYESKLAEELEGQDDHHFHPVEPFMLRLSLGRKF